MGEGNRFDFPEVLSKCSGISVENSELFRMGAGEADNMLGLEKKKKKEQSRRYLLLEVDLCSNCFWAVKSLQPNAPLTNVN